MSFYTVAIYLHYLSSSTQILTAIRNIPAEKLELENHLLFKDSSTRYYQVLSETKSI